MKNARLFRVQQMKMLLLVVVTLLAIHVEKSNGVVFQVTNASQLQAALDSARTNGVDDIINLQQGIYIAAGPFIYGTASSAQSEDEGNDSHSLMLSGGWDESFTWQNDDPLATRLDGNNLNPVLHIMADAANVSFTFTIENLTIENGYTRSTDPNGAGILAYTDVIDNGSIHLTVRNCVFQNNYAANSKSGGGIYCNGFIEVYDSKFLSNSAYNGGAMLISYDSDENQLALPSVKNCYFQDNSNYGDQGNCIWNNCALVISNCIFKGRSNGESSGNGSTIWGQPGSHLLITNSVFSGIRIKYDGTAIQSFNGAMDITNCLFVNNHCGIEGDDAHGTIAYYHNGNPGGKTINITNCTFVGSSSIMPKTGAIYNHGAIINLNNCIFWDNNGNSGVYNHEDNTGAIKMCNCDYYGTLIMDIDVTNGGGNFSADPQFIGNGIYQLGASSPCIDAGNNELVPIDTADLDNDGNVTEPTPLDLKGQTRFYDDPYTNDTGFGNTPFVDVGAYEFLLTSRFGSFDEQKNVKLTLKDCDDNDVTFSLSGPGYGVMNGSDCNFSQIVLYDTTEKSQMTISTKTKVQTSIGGIICQGPLKGITAKTTDLRGDITINGSLGSITFDDGAFGHTITIGPSAKPKAGVLMKFDQIKDLTINSNMPIKSLTATEWLDTDQTPDEVNAPSVGSLIIKGNKKAALTGDLQANLNIGYGIGNNLTEPVLKSAKIAGAHSGNSAVHGNVGTAKIKILQGRLDVEGDVKSIKVNHPLTLMTYPEDSGELIIGGKAYIKAGKDKIKVKNGAVLYTSQDPNIYRLEDLRRYDQMGAWWDYTGNYTTTGSLKKVLEYFGIPSSGPSEFTVQVESRTMPINGHDCTVVTSISEETGSSTSTAWYTDEQGTHLARWSGAGFSLSINTTVVAPEFLVFGSLYKSSGTLTGSFNSMDAYGNEVTGDISGTISSNLKLSGHEEVSTPAGNFLAAKIQITEIKKGTINNIEYEDETYTGSFSITTKQTYWAVPEIGIIKASTKMYERSGSRGLGSATFSILEDYALSSY